MNLLYERQRRRIGLLIQEIMRDSGENSRHRTSSGFVTKTKTQPTSYTSLEDDDDEEEEPTDRQTDGRTDGRTQPLIEMRGRI